jgi:hypothetical protein
MVPNQDPAKYLHIQESGTGRPANDWTVAVFDSGADLTLCSKRYAIAHDLQYGGAGIGFNTAGGGHTKSLGMLLHPLEFWLGKGTRHACKAQALVHVVDGADDLYDLILSMEVIAQWDASASPSQRTLTYYPDSYTTGSRTRSGSLPLLIMHHPGTKTRGTATAHHTSDP